MDYGLIGEKLGHSYSKIIHEKLAGYVYDLMPMTAEELKFFLTGRKFKAVNVTIPYKQTVIPYLDELDNSAAKIGAVNTIINRNDKLKGYNTDVSGFSYMLHQSGTVLRNKKVLVLGNGGAAKAVLEAIKAESPKTIIIGNRHAGNGCILYEDCIKNHSNAEVIINTTPVGMYPDVEASPIDLDYFPNLKSVLDIIYNPKKTKLLLQAEKLGISNTPGLLMLVAQAKFAAEIFLDKKIDNSLILPICKELEQEMH